MRVPTDSPLSGRRRRCRRVTGPWVRFRPRWSRHHCRNGRPGRREPSTNPPWTSTTLARGDEEVEVMIACRNVALQHLGRVQDYTSRLRRDDRATAPRAHSVETDQLIARRGDGTTVKDEPGPARIRSLPAQSPPMVLGLECGTPGKRYRSQVLLLRCRPSTPHFRQSLWRSRSPRRPRRARQPR